MFYILLLIILFLVTLHVWLYYNKNALIMRKIPGPKEIFIFGNTLDIVKTPGKFYFFSRLFTTKYFSLLKYK